LRGDTKRSHISSQERGSTIVGVGASVMPNTCTSDNRERPALLDIGRLPRSQLDVPGHRVHQEKCVFSRRKAAVVEVSDHHAAKAKPLAGLPMIETKGLPPLAECSIFGLSFSIHRRYSANLNSNFGQAFTTRKAPKCTCKEYTVIVARTTQVNG
jgi:hypothetical protein